MAAEPAQTTQPAEPAHPTSSWQDSTLLCGLPVAVGWSLAETLRHARGTPYSFWGLILFLTGIGAAYALDRLAEPRLRRPALALAAGISGALLLFAALHLPPAFREAVLGLAALSLTYPFFKRFPLTKTLAVTVAWAWGAAVLPFAGRAAPGPLWTRSWESGILPPLALLVAANTILCDLKDRERDRDADIRTLPVIYGPGVTCRIATALLILSLVLAAIQGSLALALPAAGLAVAAQFPTLLGRQVAGPLIADSLLLLPGLLTLAGA